MGLISSYNEYIHDLEENLQKMILEHMSLDLKFLNGIWDISIKYQDDGLDIKPHEDGPTFRYDIKRMVKYKMVDEFLNCVVDKGDIKFNMFQYHNKLLDLKKIINIIDGDDYSISILISPKNESSAHRKLMRRFSMDIKSHFSFIDVDKYSNYEALGFFFNKYDLI